MNTDKLMDYLRMRDGRNPYGAAGGYVTSGRRGRRGGRRDRAMEDNDYRYGDREYSARTNDSSYSQYDNEDGRRDYEYSDQYSGRDGHHMMGRGETYHPIEAMGYFNGYYGMGDHRGNDYDMARRGRDYDYGMDRRDYDYRRDYDHAQKGGEYLKDEELKHWSEKLKREIEEKDKQFLTKENIKKKAEEMGIKFDKFSMEEFYVTVLMMYTDYCKTLGTANMGLYLSLAKDWLCDEDVAVKYGEKLATYFDYIVNG